MRIVKRLNKIGMKIRLFLTDPAKQTYFPELPRKSPFEVRLEHLKWYARYRNFNKYYYLYGLDRKDISQNDYLPYMLFYKIRDEINAVGNIGEYKANYICMLRDKFIFGRYLESLGLPTPKILALCDKQTVRWIDSNIIEPLDNICRRDDFDCFLKQLLSESAEGVHPLALQRGRIFLNRTEATIEDVRTAIRNKSIIQQRVIQHDRMNQLYPHAVNTVRVVTAQNNGRAPEPLSAMVRIGAGGRHSDNWGFGGIAVGADLHTGKLSNFGMFRPDFGKRVDSHPDTGVKFGQFVIPFFEETLRLAVDLHQYFYGIHSIGWDFAITPAGPTCIEGNDDWGLPMMQIFDPKVLRRYFATLPAAHQAARKLGFDNHFKGDTNEYRSTKRT
jgi:hypothetical protein